MLICKYYLQNNFFQKNNIFWYEINFENFIALF